MPSAGAMLSLNSSSIPCAIRKSRGRSRYSPTSPFTRSERSGSGAPSVWLTSYLVICGRDFTRRCDVRSYIPLMAAKEDSCYVDLSRREREQGVECLVSHLRCARYEHWIMRSVSD